MFCNDSGRPARVGVVGELLEGSSSESMLTINLLVVAGINDSLSQKAEKSK